MSTPSTQDDYTTIAEHLSYGTSKRLRAVLEKLMTPDQARMAAALPGTAADVADKTGFDEGRVKEELDALFFKGAVFPRGDFNNREFYRFARSVGQLHDASQGSQELDIHKDSEFYALWHDFVMNEWYPDVGKATQADADAKPFQRIVPSPLALEGLSGVLPTEDYRGMVKAQETIALVPCSCRVRTASVGEPCEHTDEVASWKCLQFGRSAQYVLARGSGKQLSQDEAMAVVDECAEDGLLHMWFNIDTIKGVNMSCNCCRDCCMTYVPMDIVGGDIGKRWAKSRYEAFIDQDKCDGCQDCVERCQFDSIEMVKPKTAGKKKGSKKLKAIIDPEKCWGCGACVPACKEEKAIGFKVVRPPEHIPSPA